MKQAPPVRRGYVWFLRTPNQAPVHFLVIPKSRDGLTQLSKAEEKHEALLGHLMFVAQKMAKKSVSPSFSPDRTRLSAPFSEIGRCLLSRVLLCTNNRLYLWMVNKGIQGFCSDLDSVCLVISFALGRHNSSHVPSS